MSCLTLNVEYYHHRVTSQLVSKSSDWFLYDSDIGANGLKGYISIIKPIYL